jgi:hypothetical protein
MRWSDGSDLSLRSIGAAIVRQTWDRGALIVIVIGCVIFHLSIPMRRSNGGDSPVSFASRLARCWASRCWTLY